MSFLLRSLLLLGLFLLSACGPQDITSGASADESERYNPGVDASDDMRFPLSGKNGKLDQRLYHMSQPSVIQSFQRWNHDMIQQTAHNPEGEPLVPPETKQRSPFRQ